MINRIDIVRLNTLISDVQLKEIVCPLQREYTALCVKEINPEQNMAAIHAALERLKDPSAGFSFFGSYFLPGSIRDDFDFGPVLFFRTSVLQELVKHIRPSTYTAFYQLWLEASLRYKICPVELSTDLILPADAANTTKDSHFNYVDPKNREVQIEMETAFSAYLYKKGALLTGIPAKVDYSDQGFPVEASVIIPVKNRKETIHDALKSALSQKTKKPFNVIVVDNHSTDGTTAIIHEFAAGDNRLIHIIPEADNLQIGGCWNLAAANPQCGKFAVQLDSDDVYSDEHTIQNIVDTFDREKCGMVVGSYTLTDFHLRTIPPGLIDHREWSEENGHNNLLRVNGIGAPRAFYTPLLRKHPAPNVSYGEDYALALVFSRLYRVGRIYKSLYYCRRWRDNTDAGLSAEALTRNNRYKDGLRTQEIEERISLNMNPRKSAMSE